MTGSAVSGVVLALVLAATQSAAGAGLWGVFEATVGKIADGDTLSFANRPETCRLAGVDAPETMKKGRHGGQPYGPEATAFLSRLVGGRSVVVLVFGSDRYGRALCWVLIADSALSVNVELVRSGLAEVYVFDQKVPPPFFQALRQVESEAQAASRGIWSLGDARESPAAFRQRVKRGSAP